MVSAIQTCGVARMDAPNTGLDRHTGARLVGQARPMTRSDLEAAFLQAWRAFAPDAPEPREQYRFAAEHVGMGPGLRKRLAAAGLQDWRFDFAWPDLELAVEIHGGVWINGRHNRGAGFESDMQKMNTAMLTGWTVLQFGATAIESGDALRTTVLAYNMKAAA